jgi:hypothetical protein
MGGGEETCLELGGGKVDAFLQRRMEVAGEGGRITLLGVLEVTSVCNMMS